MTLTPFLAVAQVLSNPVPTNDNATQQALVGGVGSASGDSTLGTIGGILGGDTGRAIGNAATKIADKVKSIMSKVCVTTKVTGILQTADKVNQWTFGGLDLLTPGGQTAQATLIKGKIVTLSDARDCLQSQIDQLASTVPVSILQAQQIQTTLDGLTKTKTTIDARLDILNDQYTLATQSIWKTILVASLLTTSKSLATNLVNKLVSQYKINDFTKYADAVATQVYDNEYIQNNASGSNADQMILRSMLTNPIAQSVIQPAVYQKTNDSLGFAPATVDLSASNPDFYTQMALVGAGGNNPFVQQMVMTDKAINAHNQALATAQSEIAQSNGLKTPRSCAGSLEQQKSIDLAYNAANKQVQDRQKLYSTLLSNPNSSSDDIARAQSDLNAAIKQLQSVPNKNVDAAGNAALDICTAIVSPPSLINKGINDAFQAITGDMTNYNNANLPFFVNAIAGIASQVSNSLIFGGKVSGTQILNENAGNIALATSYATNYVGSELQSKQNNGLTVSVQRSDDGSNKTSATYSIEWDAQSVSGATGLSVTGPGLPANMSGLVQSKLSATVPATVVAPGNYIYTITAYGQSKADVKATVTITVTPSSVAGANVAKPLEAIRGPSGINPRGQE